MPVSSGSSNEFRETVRSQTDLVALIGETVRLTPVRGGREHIGLCPFHDDHNPSLHVYSDQQSFRCWVCNTGGDCFSFVEQSERVGFRDALEILARRAGVPIPSRRGTPAGEQALHKSRLFEVLLWAQDQFHRMLLTEPAAQAARDYLASRGFSPATIAQFRMGFHPDDWTWLVDRARGRFTPQELCSVGLAKERDNGAGFFDYFVGRVLFPIHNERGQPVGFGGRVLPGADGTFGKYFNSHENAVFHKSRLVYALNHARDALKATDTAVVVEGYTDCIAAHQAGLTNVVATLGTALTEMQVATIKRFARKVVLVYDGDEAGQLAAARAISRFLAQDVDLRILTLPGGQDPAEFLAAHRADRLRELIAHAPEAFEFAFDTFRRKYGMDSVDARRRVLDDVLVLLHSVPQLARNVSCDLYVRRTAQRLGMPEETVRQEFASRRPEPARRRVDSPQAGQPASAAPVREAVERVLQGRLQHDDRLESELMQCLLVAPRWAGPVLRELPLDEFTNPAFRRIMELLRERDSSEPDQNGLAGLLAALDHEPLLKQLLVWLDEQGRRKQMASKLTEDLNSPDGCPSFLRSAIDRWQWRRAEQSHQQMVMRLFESGDGAHELDAEAVDILRRSSEFHQKRATPRVTG
jgi:DNA primase